MSVPGVFEQRFQQALALHQNSKFEEAITVYRQLLRLLPKNFGILFGLGVCLCQKGELEQGVKFLTDAVSSNPKSADAQIKLGAALISLGRYNEGIKSCSAAIRLNPGSSEAYFNRGFALNELQRFDEALLSYDKAISLERNHIGAHNGRSIVLASCNRLEEALVACDLVISLMPNFAEAFCNRAGVLLRLLRYDEALATCDKAISIKPDYAEAYNNRAIALKELNRLEEALASYEIAIRINPDIDSATSAQLKLKLEMCNWDNLEQGISRLRDIIGQRRILAIPFHVLAIADDLGLQMSCSETFAKSKFGEPSQPLGLKSKRNKRKIGIGYFSSDFRQHAVSILTAEMFEHHNHEEFELHGFAFGPKSDDDMRKRISASFDTFTDIGSFSTQEALQLARKCDLDIAVDLNGYTKYARTELFSARIAPIQVNYLGFPGTMGASFIDYIVADETLIPPASREFYNEKIVYMPASYQANDSKRKISEISTARQQWGLPEHGFVYCCFNNSYKITPSVFDVWMRILDRVGGSVLWLLADSKVTVTNLKKEAEKRNIDPNRVIFAEHVPLPDHLARHRAADLFLDTLPYNAHTTASDALWAGLPVLTCIGNSFAARVAASLLTALDLRDLVVDSLPKYEELAVTLAMAPNLLSSLKAKLLERQGTSDLFSGKAFARSIEAAYLQMYDRWQDGLPADHIFLSASQK